MLVDIRGTNGAGKSYIVRHLLDTYHKKPLFDDNGKILGYSLRKKPKVGIVGRYETECGGCDGIKTAAMIEERIRDFMGRFEHLVFEGITISHTVTRYAGIADDVGIDNYTFAILDTPLRTCIARVRARRRRKGNTKPFNPNKHMGLSYDYKRVREATRDRLIAEGYTVVDLKHRNPIPQVMELLR